MPKLAKALGRSEKIRKPMSAAIGISTYWIGLTVAEGA